MRVDLNKKPLRLDPEVAKRSGSPIKKSGKTAIHSRYYRDKEYLL